MIVSAATRMPPLYLMATTLPPVTIGYVVRCMLARFRPGRDEFLGGTLGSARRRPLRASGGGRGGCSGKGGSGTQVSEGGVGRAAAVFLNGMIKRAPGRAAEALLKAQSNYHINNSMEVRRSAGSLRMRVHAAVQHSCCSILLRVPSCFPVSFAQGSVPWAAGQGAAAEHARREIQVWAPLPQQSDMSSTYSQHFQAWPIVSRPKSHKPKDERPTSAHPFDTKSTMQDSFQNWSGIGTRTVSCRPTSAYEAKVWNQPISTTHREAFQQWGAIKRQPFRPQQQRVAADDTPTGRSTAQDSYQPFMSFVRMQSAKPEEKRVESNHRFEGTTTSRAAYLPWPVTQQKRGRRPAEAPGWMDSKAGGTPFPNSTYRDMFREIKIPTGASSALGLQVVGGKFYQVLPRGTKPPATKKVLMTTASDRQSSLDIVVVVTSDEAGKRGRKVGEFELDGIAPNKAGVPQIEVSFNLSTDNSLRVSAVDNQGNRARSLTVKEKIRLF